MFIYFVALTQVLSFQVCMLSVLKYLGSKGYSLVIKEWIFHIHVSLFLLEERYESASHFPGNVTGWRSRTLFASFSVVIRFFCASCPKFPSPQPTNQKLNQPEYSQYMISDVQIQVCGDLYKYRWLGLWNSLCPMRKDGIPSLYV